MKFINSKINIGDIYMNSIFTLPAYPYAEPNLTIICIMIFFVVVYIICQLTRN